MLSFRDLVPRVFIIGITKIFLPIRRVIFSSILKILKYLIQYFIAHFNELQ